MQEVYGYPSQRTYAGDIVSCESRVFSKPSAEKVLGGSVVGYVGDELLLVQNPSSNKFVFSADLVTSNKINLNVTVKTIVDGKEVSTTTAMSEVTFATSHSATIDAIVTAIEAIDSNLNATKDATDTNGRTIYVEHADKAVVIISSVAVTAGSSQASVSYDFYGKLLGVAVRKGNGELDADNNFYIKPTEQVSILKGGVINVLSIDAMTMDSSLYVQFRDNGTTVRGQIRTGADSNKALAMSTLKPNAKVSAGAISEVEINIP